MIVLLGTLEIRVQFEGYFYLNPTRASPKLPRQASITSEFTPAFSTSACVRFSCQNPGHAVFVGIWAGSRDFKARAPERALNEPTVA
jgi:hypothetical protein